MLGCDGQIGNPHCLLPLLDNALFVASAIGKVTALADAAISEAVLEARGCGLSEADGELVIATIQLRRDCMRSMVDDNRKLFRGISQWDLGVYNMAPSHVAVLRYISDPVKNEP